MTLNVWSVKTKICRGPSDIKLSRAHQTCSHTYVDKYTLDNFSFRIYGKLDHKLAWLNLRTMKVKIWFILFTNGSANCWWKVCYYPKYLTKTWMFCPPLVGLLARPWGGFFRGVADIVQFFIFLRCLKASFVIIICGISGHALFDSHAFLP